MALNAIFADGKTFLFKFSFYSQPFKAKISRVDDISLQLYVEDEIGLGNDKKFAIVPPEKAYPSKLGHIIAVPFSQLEWGIEFGE